MDASTSKVGRERIGRIFRYLKALNDHRNPPKRDIGEQPWKLWLSELPWHPAIVTRTSGGGEGKEKDFILKVGRPELAEWLESEWDNPQQAELVAKERSATGEERFDAQPERVAAFERYRAEWNSWAEDEGPAREAMRIFEELYELHGRMEREAER